MTDDDIYDLLEGEFETLYEEDQDSPRYTLAAAEVYDQIRNQGYTSEAVEVQEYLDAGDVKQAEELTEQLLEEDSQ